VIVRFQILRGQHFGNKIVHHVVDPAEQGASKALALVGSSASLSSARLLFLMSSFHAARLRLLVSRCCRSTEDLQSGRLHQPRKMSQNAQAMSGFASLSRLRNTSSVGMIIPRLRVNPLMEAIVAQGSWLMGW
jgi:hypothetical protein